MHPLSLIISTLSSAGVKCHFWYVCFIRIANVGQCETTFMLNNMYLNSNGAYKVSVAKSLLVNFDESFNMYLPAEFPLCTKWSQMFQHQFWRIYLYG